MRQAIGEVYFHGLDILNAKDEEIDELKLSITKYRLTEASHGQEFVNVKKTSDEAVKEKLEGD